MEIPGQSDGRRRRISVVLSQWAAEGSGATSWIRGAYDAAQARRGRGRAVGRVTERIAEVALGQPLGQPPAAVLEALERAVAERWPGRFAYLSDLGYPELRERAALECDLPGLGGECVAITAGASGALTVALRVFADPGTEALAISPVFPEYGLYCRAAGVRLVAVPSGPGFRLDIGALDRALTARTRVFFLNTPSNPTGRVLSDRELSAVGRCRSAGLEVAPPDAGLYLFFRVPAPDPDAFLARLNERNVFVAPGRGFGVPDHVRVCFASPIEAVERAIDVIGELAMAPSP